MSWFFHWFPLYQFYVEKAFLFLLDLHIIEILARGPYCVGHLCWGTNTLKHQTNGSCQHIKKLVLKCYTNYLMISCWFKNPRFTPIACSSSNESRTIGLFRGHIEVWGLPGTVLKDLWTLEWIESYVISTNVDGFSCLNIDFDEHLGWIINASWPSLFMVHS